MLTSVLQTNLTPNYLIAVLDEAEEAALPWAVTHTPSRHPNPRETQMEAFVSESIAWVVCKTLDTVWW